MANNRMWLVCGQTGKRVLLGKHMGDVWYRHHDDLAERIDAIFTDELKPGDLPVGPWGGTTWRIEYDRNEHELDEALRVARLPKRE